MNTIPYISVKKQKLEHEFLESLLEYNLVLDRKESLKIEYGILIEEYKTLKSEILQLLHEARQITNLALTAIGVFIAGTAAVIQMQIAINPKVLLLVPFLFYFLTCIQLRYIFQALDMGKYLSSTTIPHIQSILHNFSLGRRQEIDKILSWEMPRRSPLRIRGLLFFPIAGASYGMPFLFSIILIGLYLRFFSPGLELSLNVENTLLTLNSIAILYCAGWALDAERKR
jgi:hypothetical protein